MRRRPKWWHVLGLAMAGFGMVFAPATVTYGQLQTQTPRIAQSTQDGRTGHVTTGEGTTDFQRARELQFQGDYGGARAAYLSAIDHATPAARPCLWLELAGLATVQDQKWEARYGFERAILTSGYDSEVVELAEGGLSMLHEAGSKKRPEVGAKSFADLFNQVDSLYQHNMKSDVGVPTDTTITDSRRPTPEEKKLNSFLDRVTPVDPAAPEH